MARLSPATMDSNSLSPYDTFQPFPRLPPELRLQIWELACYPRTVNVIWRAKRLFSPDPIPAVLHTCRESRAKACYTAAFTIDGSPQYIWVNFDLDTIKLSDYALNSIEVKERAQIRRAVVQVVETQLFVYFNIEALSAMRSLKQLELLSVEGLLTWGTNIEWVKARLENAYGRDKDWTCPEIRIIDKSTGEEMNTANYREKYLALRGRGRGGRGGARAGGGG